MHEIMALTSSILALVGFGLSLGLSPQLYGATADMLARAVNPWPRLCCMVGGLYFGATILFLLFQTFNPESFVSSVKNHVDHALFSRTVDLVSGFVFLLLSIVLAGWAIRVSPLPQREQKRPKTNGHMLSYFMLGLGSSVIGFTTLPIMYLTARVVSSFSSEIAPRVLAYAVFLLAFGAPFFALAWVWGRFPRASQRATELYSRALARDYRWAGACACLLIGAAFILMGLYLHR